METELADIDSLKKMNGVAAENYAGLFMEFEFGWDKGKVIAEVRDAMKKAEAVFPEEGLAKDEEGLRVRFHRVEWSQAVLHRQETMDV